MTQESRAETVNAMTSSFIARATSSECLVAWPWPHLWPLLREMLWPPGLNRCSLVWRSRLCILWCSSSCVVLMYIVPNSCDETLDEAGYGIWVRYEIVSSAKENTLLRTWGLFKVKTLKESPECWDQFWKVYVFKCSLKQWKFDSKSRRSVWSDIKN